MPWLITPLLMVGGAFLCFEGVEKISASPCTSGATAMIVVQEAQPKPRPKAWRRRQCAKPSTWHLDAADYEKEKVKRRHSAPDFILSAEILAIALSTVANEPVGQAVAACWWRWRWPSRCSSMALVAGIVRMDDVGLCLMSKTQPACRPLGRGLIAFTPWLMKGLSIVGTAAMFLVGGSLLVHGICPDPNLAGCQHCTPRVVSWPSLAPLLVHVGGGRRHRRGVVVLVVAAPGSTWR